MDKWFKDILPDKDPYHNRGRDQMRKKGGPEFECLWSRYPVVGCGNITTGLFGLRNTRQIKSGITLAQTCEQ